QGAQGRLARKGLEGTGELLDHRKVQDIERRPVEHDPRHRAVEGRDHVSGGGGRGGGDRQPRRRKREAALSWTSLRTASGRRPSAASGPRLSPQASPLVPHRQRSWPMRLLMKWTTSGFRYFGAQASTPR